MQAKIYAIDGKEYRQGVMSVEQIKAFLKLLKEIGVGQLIGAGQFDFDRIFDQVIEHDKIELFLATVLVEKDQGKFDKQKYVENLQRFGGVDGDMLAEVIEDFLLFNEPWFKRLKGKMDGMDKMDGVDEEKAPVA